MTLCNLYNLCNLPLDAIFLESSRNMERWTTGPGEDDPTPWFCSVCGEEIEDTDEGCYCD